VKNVPISDYRTGTPEKFADLRYWIEPKNLRKKIYVPTFAIKSVLYIRFYTAVLVLVSPVWFLGFAQRQMKKCAAVIWQKTAELRALAFCLLILYFQYHQAAFSLLIKETAQPD
jgi:hypothetical protein